MRNMLRRIAAAVCALCLLSGAALGADAADFTTLMPLLDLTASAALRVGENPEEITPECALSPAFVQNFFLLGQEADAKLGIGPELLGDPGGQKQYLASVFDAALPALDTIDAADGGYAYVGVQPMASEMSDDGVMTLYGDLYQAEGPLIGLDETQYLETAWLGLRAVAQARRDAQSPGGWRIISLVFESAAVADGGEWGYFDETMSEYQNEALGFSIQYPTLFMQGSVTENADGVSGQLADGSASFRVQRRANEQSVTLLGYAEDMLNRYADASMSLNDVSCTVRITHQREDGQTQVDMAIVTEGWIYEAQLCYAPGLAESFALYSEYMLNSFMADELGIG
ncbi:MAG: hypothetical protein IJ507_03205 [Clostridia bacterium]|nr:hypothetical protein [Clostridia bacterium]